MPPRRAIASTETIRKHILSGATVRMGFAGGRRVWWLEEPYIEVEDGGMREACIGHNGNALLEESGDCLFGWPGNSQTWRSVFS